jgi:predicted nucleic acid-binding protein
MTGRTAAPALVYVDTSVLVAALARDDAHHARARSWLIAHEGRLVTSVIAEVELHRALARRKAPAVLRGRATRLLAGSELIELTSEIRRRAAGVAPASVRSLDAIHVAAALAAEVGAFASLDARQAVAAEEMGLALARL